MQIVNIGIYIFDTNAIVQKSHDKVTLSHNAILFTS